MPRPVTGPDERLILELEHPIDVGYLLQGYGIAMDPTRRDAGRSVVWAMRTPTGPATLRVAADHAAVVVEAWGDGAGWLVGRADHLLGASDDPRDLHFDHDVLDELNRRHPGARHGATGCVVDGLFGRVLGQRVLAVEAGRSWLALCRHLGDPAPGPFGLVLPPDPERVAQTPTWWFHEHGVDRGRASILVDVARRHRRLQEAADMDLPDAYRRLRAIRGIGPWTANGVARTALGDPDAIIVGDYWIKHHVVSFLSDRPRGTDDEMLELVRRWTGQRGRVERLIGLSGHRLQRFAAGRPTPRIARL